MDIETVLALIHLTLTLWLVWSYFRQCQVEQALREEIDTMRGERAIHRIQISRLYDDLNDALEVKQHELLNRRSQKLV